MGRELKLKIQRLGNRSRKRLNFRCNVNLRVYVDDFLEENYKIYIFFMVLLTIFGYIKII